MEVIVDGRHEVVGEFTFNSIYYVAYLEAINGRKIFSVYENCTKRVLQAVVNAKRVDIATLGKLVDQWKKGERFR